MAQGTGFFVGPSGLSLLESGKSCGCSERLLWLYIAVLSSPGPGEISLTQGRGWEICQDAGRDD